MGPFSAKRIVEALFPGGAATFADLVGGGSSHYKQDRGKTGARDHVLSDRQHQRDSPSLAHVAAGGPKVAWALRGTGYLRPERSLSPSSPLAAANCMTLAQVILPPVRSDLIRETTIPFLQQEL